MGVGGWGWVGVGGGWRGGGGGGVKVVLIDQVINIPLDANWHAILFHTGNISLTSLSCFLSRRGISLHFASPALTIGGISLNSLPCFGYWRDVPHFTSTFLVIRMVSVTPLPCLLTGGISLTSLICYGYWRNTTKFQFFVLVIRGIFITSLHFLLSLHAGLRSRSCMGTIEGYPSLRIHCSCHEMDIPYFISSTLVPK